SATSDARLFDRPIDRHTLLLPVAEAIAGEARSGTLGKPACASEDLARLEGKQTTMTMGGMDEVFGLFPTPFLRAQGTLSARLVDGLVQHFSALSLSGNKASNN